MRFLLSLSFFFFAAILQGYAQSETAQKSLNQYVEFLDHTSEMVINRFRMTSVYQTDVNRYKKKPNLVLKLASSGALEEYYYRKSLEALGITPTEKKQLNESVQGLWQLLNQIDETGKKLETYVRLKAYEEDQLKQSDALVSKIQLLINQYAGDKKTFYDHLKKVHQKYRSAALHDPCLNTAQTMEQIVITQQKLIEALPYNLNHEARSEWPVGILQTSMLDDQKLISDFENLNAFCPYPASSAVKSFLSALLSMQKVKKGAIDGYNFAAQQNSLYSNEIYLALINHFNNDLLSSYKSFVNYSEPKYRLLDYPEFSPIISPDTTGSVLKTSETAQFRDQQHITLKIEKAKAQAAPSTVRTLNDYLEFINESLRQMRILQTLLRDYQSSAQYHRDPAQSKSHAALTYSHQDFKIPVSAFQLLNIATTTLPQTYRSTLKSQAETLLDILKEMDGLSIQLITYTHKKQYLQDKLVRSDAILDRYAYLFEVFDQKKEQLYDDVRHIYDSYPNENPASSWFKSGSAMLGTMDNNRDVLFGIKAYLKGTASKTPVTGKLENGAKELMANEYQNLKGLQRLGRSNGLCPYSPYEDLAENSLRFATMTNKLNTASSTNPYSSFYYFYNNELVYQYNKFVELSKTSLLKEIIQPDVFAFRRLTSQNSSDNEQKENNYTVQKPEKIQHTNLQISTVTSPEKPAKQNTITEKVQVQHDTVYIERIRVDTVYKNVSDASHKIKNSLEGYAPNNMVLLLDVSTSMDSPLKLPLLKRSIKSLVTLLRPEDQIAVIVYSGKAKILLKPTTGANTKDITKVVDMLKPTGDTDANEGLRLAYKVVNKQYIRAGNNRIVLATDGEFPVSEEVLEIIADNAKQDINLTVFTFGKNPLNGLKLKKLSTLGQGNYQHITPESADLQLIIEAQAKKSKERN